MEKHSKQMGAPSEHKISTQQPLLGVGLRPIVQKHVVGDSERKKMGNRDEDLSGVRVGE